MRDHISSRYDLPPSKESRPHDATPNTEYRTIPPNILYSVIYFDLSKAVANIATRLGLVRRFGGPLRPRNFARLERLVYLLLGGVAGLFHYFRNLADQELARLFQQPFFLKREFLRFASCGQ